MSFTTFLKERWGLIAFISGVAYFILLIRNDMVQNAQLKFDKDIYIKNIEVERNKREFLNRKMVLLKKNSYIEVIAREKLGLIGKGEKAYKVIIK